MVAAICCICLERVATASRSSATSDDEPPAPFVAQRLRDTCTDRSERSGDAQGIAESAERTTR
eukprot:585015-Prymnesium_polylepis.1